MARAPVPLLLVTRSNTRSTVHRPGYSDYVGVKRYDAAGEVIGEHRFIGLFSVHRLRRARRRDPAAAPEGGGRAAARRAARGRPPGQGAASTSSPPTRATTCSRSARTSCTTPRWASWRLGERQRLRLFLWRDPYERFVSCLVYVPREAYSTELRKKFQAILMAAFAGQRADFDVLLGDTLLARVHFTIRTPPGQVPAYDRARDRGRGWPPPRGAGTTSCATRWSTRPAKATGMALFKRWGAAFPQVYREIASAPAPRCPTC